MHHSRAKRSRSATWSALIALAAFTTLLPAACKTGRVMIYTCPEPCETCDDPCHPCIEAKGECVPETLFGWVGPVLLWAGRRDLEPPPCPEHAPTRMYYGYDGLTIERGCPSCSCGPITCMPPSTMAARDQPVCTGDGPSDDDLHLPVPETWDGACQDVPAIAEADMAALVASEARVGVCKPNLGMVPASDAFAWDFHAMACERKRIPRTCHDGVQWCAPQAEGTFASVSIPAEMSRIALPAIRSGACSSTGSTGPSRAPPARAKRLRSVPAKES
ncbi:hypothetical protein [Chondromyces crocatus]|nr:hypothetical protein [Chondromyces crocatus]